MIAQATMVVTGMVHGSANVQVTRLQEQLEKEKEERKKVEQGLDMVKQKLVVALPPGLTRSRDPAQQTRIYTPPHGMPS